MIKSEILPECYTCICRACGHLGCPHRNGKYKRCYLCTVRGERRPILSCTNFYRKEYPRYRIKRVYKSPKIRYVDKTNADDIRVMLTTIIGLLSPGTSPVTDVNCVRHDCLCLKCSLFTTCESKCKLCVDFKGQHPVKLCANKVLYERSKWK